MGRKNTVIPLAVKEILACKRRGTEREDIIQVAESLAYQIGLKGARRRRKAIETGREKGNVDRMAVLLSHHLSKTLMDLTSLPSSVPSLSPPLQPPPLYLAPQDLPQPPPVGPNRNLIRCARERRRENGTRVEAWRIRGGARADRDHRRHQGITAMSQTTIQTNWRSMCCLWMVKLWIPTTHFWRIRRLLPCLQSRHCPAQKVNLPLRLHDITRKRNLTDQRKLAILNPHLPIAVKVNASRR